MFKIKKKQFGDNQVKLPKLKRCSSEKVLKLETETNFPL